jgi:broad specificity phosphatase PhoE
LSLAHPLCIVRHGETDWNVEGRLQGQRDIHLNGRGRDQAASVGRLLKRDYPGVLDFDFVSSPLTRAQDTMRLMRGAMGLDPQAYGLDDRLKELTFGGWEGFTWDEMMAKDPAGCTAREADKWGFVPPAGESYAMLSTRIEGWLAELNGPTLAVTHGGVARVLLGLIAGVSHKDLPLRDIKQGRALLFENSEARWI